MLASVRSLVHEVAVARAELHARLEVFPAQATEIKPSAAEWSAAELMEHLVWAEMGGLRSMMVALDAWRRGEPVWTEPNPNRGRDIESIVQDTWQPKEKAPESAVPHWGAPLPFWVAWHGSCQRVVEMVAASIREDELDDVVFPHPISGPLTMRQRLAFLAFHMRHHVPQLERIERSVTGDPGRPPPLP